MINNFTGTGRLVKDAELKFTGNGTAVATFTLAIERAFKNAQGEKETDFLNCVIWRKSAETLANYTKKGSLIGVEGAVQTRNYENKEGQRVYVTEINVEKFHFLESKGADSQNKPSVKKTDDPFANSGQSIDISDDDMPF